MMYFVKLKDGTWDMMMSLNGLLAGMIATCSCCNVIQPWAALLVGFTGAFVYYAQSYLTEHIFHIDDPVRPTVASGFSISRPRLFTI